MTARRWALLPASEMTTEGIEPTHWGTQEMIVRDPDGRLISLQAPRET